MQTPAVAFYRYLLLSGKGKHEIERTFQRLGLYFPEDPGYHREQLQWAANELKTPRIESTKALVRVGFGDMLAAHRKKPAGRACSEAFLLLCRPDYREPIETLLLAGWEDWEVRGAINNDVNRPFNISLEAVVAYRKYFFNPDVLSYSDRKHLAFLFPWLRVALVSADPRVIEESVGLRYTRYQDKFSAARDIALTRWLATMSMTPIRTDREGLKAFAAMVSSLKSLESSAIVDEASQKPAIELIKERLELPEARDA